MTGHQLSVHTWSHHALTSLTNEQIVAELGWAAKVIKDVVGVTPNTFRPPYGDIDDRVRAIAAQMGLTPIMWSGYNGAFFDTTDWGIASGKISVDNAVATFEQILNTYVPKLNSGFIVLEHDLYAQSVDVAIKYFLPLATQGKYALKSIIDCLHQPLANAYVETYSNSSSTTLTHTSTAIPSTSTSSFITSSSTTSTSGVAMTTSTSPKVESDAKSAAHHLGISFAVVVGTLASFFVH
jgi:hypothetical protein